MYGGAGTPGGIAADCQGLSPHVRGSQLYTLVPMLSKGSIPACTGEPICRAFCQDGAAVYPRMYGGALAHFNLSPLVSGLSPHVRGSHTRLFPLCQSCGSIPACTGEPPCRACPVVQSRVYPRMYGGAVCRTGWNGRGMGLSPHVRGSQ